MPLASWLFVKDSESIWVERPQQLLMIVAVPGNRHEQREFLSEQALQAFQVHLAERLTGDGWFLWGVNRERRYQADRRAGGRAAPDRRRVPSVSGAGR